VKVVKNKMAPPFREVEFDILYGQGISKSAEILDMGSDASIVQKSGAWYAYEGERIGQGRDAARQYLEQHPELMKKIELRLLEHFKIGKPGGDSQNSGSKANDAGDAKAAPSAAPAKKAAPARVN
jgi:recombination protein RecA